MLFGLGKPALVKYLEKNPNVHLVVVAGSYGRKSAIRALGMILSQEFKVSFGLNKGEVPEIILLDYESAVKFPDVKPDIVAVTACKNSDEAQRYFALANKAKAVIVNHNDVPKEFMQYLTNQNLATYGDELPANYYFEDTDHEIDGQAGDIVNIDGEHIPIKIKILGEHNVRPILMACAVGRFFGMNRQKILEGVDAITPLHGRMSPAKGIMGSYIIDDSADGTPTSVYYGLRAIYAIQAPSRIIVTDDESKLKNMSLELMSEALILTDHKPEQDKPKFRYFTDRLELIHYLGTRMEENGIVLLEIPLPEIIEEYLW